MPCAVLGHADADNLTTIRSKRLQLPPTPPVAVVHIYVVGCPQPRLQDTLQSLGVPTPAWGCKGTQQLGLGQARVFHTRMGYLCGPPFALACC
jgi:hypothetical protein